MTFSVILYFWEVYYPAFWSQFTPELYFSVPFCSSWGCVNQCIVDLLFLLFPCDILSVLRGTVFDSLASSKFPSSVPLGFSTSQVSTLWVYNCSKLFFIDQDGLSFGHRIRYICFFKEFIHLDDQSVVDGIIFFDTRNHVMHHGLAFSNPVFFYSFSLNNWFHLYYHLKAFFKLFLFFFFRIIIILYQSIAIWTK